MFNDTYGYYGYYGLVSNPGGDPAPDLAVVLGGNTMWVPAVGLLGTFLILLFPDGGLPSPRWKPLAWLSAVAIVLSSSVIMFMPGSLEMGPGWEGLPPTTNPLGLESLRPALESMTFVIALIPLCFVGCAVSLVQRFRRSRGVERLQLKWLAFATATVAGIYLTVMLLSLVFLVGGTSEPAWLGFLTQASVFSFPLIPIAAGIAILKHRLFDIDVVIKKTVVFGSLAGFITVVYIAVVVGVGRLLGSTGDRDLGLSVVATAIVAVAFQPVRQRFEHLASRLVYGRRATPYQVLSEFSGRVAETYATDDVLPRMARQIKEGIGAQRAEVWLRAGTQLRPAASYPQGDVHDTGPIPVADDELPAFDGVDRAIEVRHQGQLLGALTVTKSPAEPLTAAEAHC
ncbi:MAG TPA: hypothetical protein VM287_07095 [Egibacteraceae bacterium]|nr:hypothetical protein [Egibacteraceae bacterium]